MQFFRAVVHTDLFTFVFICSGSTYHVALRLLMFHVLMFFLVI